MKNQIQKLVSIRKVLERLNPVTVKNILFTHAWSSCNTTSAVFNKSKTVLVKLIGDHEVLDICSTFDKTEATPEEVGKTRVKLFVTTYGMYYESF